MPVAQLDRVSDSDSEGRAFESHRAYHSADSVLRNFLFGGGRWIRFSAEKPRRLQQSTGLLLRAGFRIHLILRNKDTDIGVFASWWGKMDSNHRRHCQQIYSLSPLATREFPHILNWSWWTDSNPRPADYKSAALPTELHQQVSSSVIIANRNIFVNNFFYNFSIRNFDPIGKDSDCISRKYMIL